MKVGLRVPELLHETEINDIELVYMFTSSHNEVVWFDIPMNKVLRVNVLNM